MLEKMGWADGKGLGKDKRGSTSHIKIKKRKQNLGMYRKSTQNIHTFPVVHISSYSDGYFPNRFGSKGKS